MKVLNRRCAGLDVHKDEVVACVRLAMRNTLSHEVRRFATTTRGLLELADWLEASGVTQVAMEATGVYWKPVWHMLEERFQLVLANAAHVHNVPGRKSDVNDATWIADLMAHGLIRASFVPETQTQEMRRSRPRSLPRSTTYSKTARCTRTSAAITSIAVPPTSKKTAWSNVWPTLATLWRSSRSPPRAVSVALPSRRVCGTVRVC